LALVGDASDNIPGVKGIGAKGAIKLLQEYSSIEKIYASEDSPQILPKVWTKLQDGEGSAILSKELATIYKKVPFDREINGDIGDIQVDNFDSFNELGLRASFDKLRNSLNLIYSSGRYIFRNAPF
jgi:DNA polymerase-1